MNSGVSKSSTAHDVLLAFLQQAARAVPQSVVLSGVPISQAGISNPRAAFGRKEERTE